MASDELRFTQIRHGLSEAPGGVLFAGAIWFVFSSFGGRLGGDWDVIERDYGLDVGRFALIRIGESKPIFRLKCLILLSGS